ncbi:UDP-glucose 4-epimerase GalE [Fluviibacter phosphoraccumulans]|uniref:UDP-glucose 4-epimerase GalE n=1 Tax=Fluviibacter phosphoraccumulans TaxID=1751046 RepID=UPI0010B9B7DF|nr:UDP-glucose 4-epimerase GalE [Fluviibacter phosphoraccumulans]BCA66206.1 UDP-glucose 4-epimerase GalE [Fluviibacter phosphoraccumulans]
MKTVLVTGGAGYIGAHTCKMLFKAGYAPVTYDNLSTGHKEFVKWGELVVGDLHDTEKLAKALEQYKPIAVIHFAASAYVGESVENPFKYYKNNVGGTLSLIEAMIRTNVKKLVFSSTCATYGVPDQLLIDELTPQHPINPYGRSKLMIEQILQDLSSRDQINYVALRYFNAAGADNDAEIGEWHDPETHLIPLAIQSADGGEILNVYGTDFATPDGTAVRDYIHVEDLAEGHIKALEYLSSGGISDAVNLGTGQGSSVDEIIKSLREIGVGVVYQNAPRRPGDPAFLVADNSKARSLLNWTVTNNNIKKTLETALTWHKKHGRK